MSLTVFWEDLRLRAIEPTRAELKRLGYELIETGPHYWSAKSVMRMPFVPRDLLEIAARAPGDLLIKAEEARDRAEAEACGLCGWCECDGTCEADEEVGT